MVYLVKVMLYYMAFMLPLKGLLDYLPKNSNFDYPADRTRLIPCYLISLGEAHLILSATCILPVLLLIVSPSMKLDP